MRALTIGRASWMTFDLNNSACLILSWKPIRKPRKKYPAASATFTSSMFSIPTEYSGRLNRATKTSSGGDPTMPFVTVQGAKINVVDEGTGTPTLFVHGVADSSDVWSPVISRLKTQ